MPQQLYFDPVARQREKHQARAQDDSDLSAGRVSPEELNRRNGFFSGLDFSRASMRRRGRGAL
jgi:hypothetical protein